MGDPVLYYPEPRHKMEGKPLTKREYQVALLLCDGHCNKTAAAELGISMRTVETFRRTLRLKLGREFYRRDRPLGHPQQTDRALGARKRPHHEIRVFVRVRADADWLLRAGLAIGSWGAH
jgi:Bacterial regulatory proteins, luxR family